MPNPVVHFEIGCQDRERSVDFYSRLFGWTTESMGPAVRINTGDGIGGHISALGHAPYQYTIFYVRVDDIQATLDAAIKLGGKTLVPPVEIPTGIFAWMADPEGNTVGLFTERKSGQ